MPTTTVTVSQPEDILPLEFLDLPSLQHGPIDETLPVLMNVLMDNQWGHAYNSGCIQGESYNGDRHSQGCKTTARQRLQAWGFRKNEQCRSLQTAAQLSQMLKAKLNRGRNDPMCPPPGHQKHVHGMPPNGESLGLSQKATARTEVDQACFASHGSYGILDLGASKTVIGSDNVAELIQSLDPDIRRQLTRCPCNITFKFGNQATLTSQQALVIPIGYLKLKVAIVKGGNSVSHQQHSDADDVSEDRLCPTSFVQQAAETTSSIASHRKGIVSHGHECTNPSSHGQDAQPFARQHDRTCRDFRVR